MSLVAGPGRTRRVGGRRATIHHAGDNRLKVYLLGVAHDVWQYEYVFVPVAQSRVLLQTGRLDLQMQLYCMPGISKDEAGVAGKRLVRFFNNPFPSRCID